jgi:hypothetical protein
MNAALLGSATSSVTGVQCEAVVASLQKLSFVELCCHTVYAVPEASTAIAGGAPVPLPRRAPAAGVVAGDVVVVGFGGVGAVLLRAGIVPLLSGSPVAVGPPVAAWTRASAPAK